MRLGGGGLKVFNLHEILVKGYSLPSTSLTILGFSQIWDFWPGSRMNLIYLVDSWECTSGKGSRSKAKVLGIRSDDPNCESRSCWSRRCRQLDSHPRKRDKINDLFYTLFSVCSFVRLSVCPFVQTFFLKYL